MSERRRHQRAPLSREAVAYVGNSQAECRTLDISVGGIALSSPTSHPLGQFARVSWAFAPGQWVDADVVIVRIDQRTNEFILGASFLRIDSAVTSRIAEIVLEYASPPPAAPLGSEPPALIVPPPPGRSTTPPASREPAAQRPSSSFRPSEPALRSPSTSSSQPALRSPATPTQPAQRPTPAAGQPMTRPTTRPSDPSSRPTPTTSQPAIHFTPQPSLPAVRTTDRPGQPVSRPSPVPSQHVPRTTPQPGRPSQAFRPVEQPFRPSEPGFRAPVRSSQPVTSSPTFRPSQPGFPQTRQSPPPSQNRSPNSPPPIARDLISQIPRSKEDLRKLYEDAMREVDSSGPKPKKP